MAEPLFGLFGRQIGPKIAVVVEGIEGGLEAWIDPQWGLGVVGTATLTLVAAENPAVGVETALALLDGSIGDAEGGVDGAIGVNCSCWAS